MTRVTTQEARRLEQEFLGGINTAQDAYERICETEAWIELGFDTYAAWWESRVVPIMRALNMRPTAPIAAAGIAQVRKEEEEAKVPPAQRRTQSDLAEMFGVHRNTIRNQDRDEAQSVHGSDLESQEAKEESPKVAIRKRRPLPAAAKESAQKIRKEIEKLERLFTDDRFSSNRDQVATLTRSHLIYTVETAQCLIDSFNEKESNSGN